MKLLLSFVICNMVVRCSGLIMEDNETAIDINMLLENAGYPKPGDIPVLNRKIFKGQRVSIREHPYVVSIRRRVAHYLVGTLLTSNLVVTVAHPLVNVPVTELGVVVGETYSDRGTFVATVVLVIIHQDFDPYTLKADIAMLRIYEDVNYKFTVKSIVVASPFRSHLDGSVAFVTGWGRCDSTGLELCLHRSSKYFPDERVDPMLRSISFKYSKSNYYCEGYKRHEVSILRGMLCLGPAREEDPVCPCLAVPGAPLVVQSRLVGLLSWGFGCGYGHDLPLIYTSIPDFTNWISYNIQRFRYIKQANLTQLFRATKASVIVEWFMQTRVITPPVKTKLDMDLEPLEIDTALADLKGTVLDVRDFIYGGLYHIEKQILYAALNNAESSMKKLVEIKKKLEKITSYPFLSNKTVFEFKWLPVKNIPNFSSSSSSIEQPIPEKT